MKNKSFIFRILAVPGAKPGVCMGNEMKIRKIFSSNRLMIAALFFIAFFSLGGCSTKEEKQPAVSSLYLQKGGAVKAVIAETFDKQYYNKDEMQQMILKEAAAYNRNRGEGRISVEKVSVDKGMAYVEMTYASAEDYAAFNDIVFFAGTPAEAQEKGYELNVVLSGVRDAQETIGLSDMLAMEDCRLIIVQLQENESLVLNQKAAYVSDNTEAASNLKTLSRKEQTEGLSYIICK